MASPVKTVLQSLFVSAWFVCLLEAFAVEKKETAEENENSVRKIQFNTVIVQELQPVCKGSFTFKWKEMQSFWKPGFSAGILLWKINRWLFISILFRRTDVLRWYTYPAAVYTTASGKRERKLYEYHKTEPKDTDKIIRYSWIIINSFFYRFRN